MVLVFGDVLTTIVYVVFAIKIPQFVPKDVKEIRQDPIVTYVSDCATFEIDH